MYWNIGALEYGREYDENKSNDLYLDLVYAKM